VGIAHLSSLHVGQEVVMSYARVDPRATDRKSPPGAASVERPIDRLSRYLEKLASSDFYGKVIVSFQHGKVCDVKIEQTKKLDEL
jgi:hypothetical protein